MPFAPYSIKKRESFYKVLFYKHSNVFEKVV